MNKAMIGLSSCGKKLDRELFESFSKSGIGYMEISEGREGCARLDLPRLRRLSAEYGVRLWSFHLPFAPFSEIDISNPELARSTVEYYAGLVRRAADIGIVHFIVHPSGEPIDQPDRAARMTCAKEHLALLAETVRPMGAVICVEDLPRTCLGNCSEEMAELLSAHSSLRSCFDTNHLLSEDPVSYVKKLGDRIVTLHVSDYDGINERHWLPGEGDLPWKGIFSALKEAGYSGPWLYELGYDCPSTLVRERDLTPGDFVRNANEIFEGRELTVIGKRKPDLGMWG